MKTVMLITNIPTPYRIPLFNELNKQMEAHGLRLKVIFGALSYPRRKWLIDMSDCKFPYRVLKDNHSIHLNPERPIFTYPGLLNVIRKERPDIIILGGFSIATIKVFLTSLFNKIPYLIWSGAIERIGEKTHFLTKLQRRLLIKKAKGFIAYGTVAKEYLISLGADRNNILIGINTVDTEFFRKETKRIAEQNAVKKGTKNILYVGHLTKGKRLDQLFYAVKSLSEIRKDFNLTLVGEGPEETCLIELAKKLSIFDFVKFIGFKQKKDLPYYFSLADLFVFPSEYDVWGLVLVEAMSVGLPCIASKLAGATGDLIKDGETGFSMDFSKIDKITEKINWIFNNKDESKKIGLNAKRFIEDHVNLGKSASGFVEAIQNTFAHEAQ